MNRTALFPAALHDHQDCVRGALAAAERSCEAQGARLTPIRRRVLELVWASHEPVGAYGLLDRLGAEGTKAVPPTVYRALDFLLEQGLVHRLERLNAFVGCSHRHGPHAAQFLICTGCRRVAELDDPAIGSALLKGAAARGFSVSRQTVEVEGLCPECRAISSSV
jgi:Fur family zinc uptake transcriptional regulator